MLKPSQLMRRLIHASCWATNTTTHISLPRNLTKFAYASKLPHHHTITPTTFSYDPHSTIYRSTYLPHKHTSIKEIMFTNFFKFHYFKEGKVSLELKFDTWHFFCAERYLSFWNIYFLGRREWESEWDHVDRRIFPRDFSGKKKFFSLLWIDRKRKIFP